MKLQELCETEETPNIFAFFRPSKGPAGITGVELQYIRPVEMHYANKTKNAEDEQKPVKAHNCKKELEHYRNKKQSHFIQPVEWWQNKEDFESGKEGNGGRHKGEILNDFKNIKIFPDYKEALAAAKSAGVLTPKK